jgi:hypothetical protein
MRTVIAVIVLLAAAPVLAQPQLVEEVPPGRSTYIRGGAFADQAHYGSLWNVGNNGADLNQAYKAYIRINLSGITFPNPSSEWYFNQLNVNVGPSTPPAPNGIPWHYSVYGLRDDLDGYDEAQLTWNNAPGNNPTSPNGVDPAETVFIGTNTAFLSGFVGWGLINNGGIGGALNQFGRADTNGHLTFIVVRANADQYVNGLSFSNLHVFVPEPTLALPALALLGPFLSLRRAR